MTLESKVKVNLLRIYLMACNSELFLHFLLREFISPTMAA